MRIFFSPYELHPGVSLNSLVPVAAARQGALLRIEHPGIGPGYADLHPWPELGDSPLKRQLEALSRGEWSSLTRNSIEFTRMDAQARASGVSLWEGLTIPKSHALVTDIAELLKNENLANLITAGFDRIKIKMGRDLAAETSALKKLVPLLPQKTLLRLDFNSSLTPSTFEAFWKTLSDSENAAIDFVEDPTPWDRQKGFALSPDLSVPLALDREVGKATADHPLKALVLKPAISSWRRAINQASFWGRRLVFTSYLDHPLGQLTAAYAAAESARLSPTVVDTGGFLSHIVYRPHRFSEMLLTRGPELIPPGGTGLGWDQELASLPWNELKGPPC